MSWKISIFLFSTLLLMTTAYSTVDINLVDDNELKLSENTEQSTGSLAEFASKAFELLTELGGTLPTGKTDDIFIVKNVDDPHYKDLIERIGANYKNLTQFVPKDDNADTYNFTTDMRNFSIELHKAKRPIEGLHEDSTEYQRVQDHFKSELVKVAERLSNHIIDLGEKYFNSLSAEKRTADQRGFYDKLKEIKTETDGQKKYKSLYVFLQGSFSEFEENLRDNKI